MHGTMSLKKTSLFFKAFKNKWTYVLTETSVWRYSTTEYCEILSVTMWRWKRKATARYIYKNTVTEHSHALLPSRRLNTNDWIAKHRRVFLQAVYYNTFFRQHTVVFKFRQHIVVFFFRQRTVVYLFRQNIVVFFFRQHTVVLSFRQHIVVFFFKQHTFVLFFRQHIFVFFFRQHRHVTFLATDRPVVFKSLNPILHSKQRTTVFL